MKKNTPKVFLDSNIWFSLIYGSENCSKIITAHIEKRMAGIISSQVLEESIRNIVKKIPTKLATFESLISANPPKVVSSSQTIGPRIQSLVSPEDQPIFSSALDAEVDYFITGNIKDFKRDKLEKLTKIKVLTPAEAVKVFKL